MNRILLASSALMALSVPASADPLSLKPVTIGPSEDTLSAGLVQKPVAEGRFKLENPSKYIGY